MRDQRTVQGGKVGTSEMVTPVTEGVPCSAAMVKIMTTFLQAQAEAMAAHVHATVAHAVTSCLTTLHWRRKQAADDGFEQ